MAPKPRILVVTYPAQGHINPGLQFAKRLILVGVEITYVTTLSAYNRMIKDNNSTNDLSFAPFSDGYDDGFKKDDDIDHFMSEIKRKGSQFISNLIISAKNEDRPFTCLVYSLLLPWASVTANQLGVPSALLWIQPATVFDIYYYYFHGYEDAIKKINNNNNTNNEYPFCNFISLPGLSLKLTSQDIPSFMNATVPNDTYSFIIPLFKEQFEKIDEESKPTILVNTFDSLEFEALNAISKFNLIGIGPLIPSAFLDGKDPFDTSFGGDLFQHSKDYIEWLNSKPKGCVIYVSFGSLCVLSKQQMEEISNGLLSFGHPFLWVIRDDHKENKEEEEDELLSSCILKELKGLGMIVPWCSQVEVLSHPSLGCFVTHCGWNSTLESLVSGVPVVAFPQWTDQGTNAKLIEDFWKTGLRVKKNKEGIVESDEIKKCLELVMEGGERGEELRMNVKRWKILAKEAAMEGGSSDVNLKAFVEEVIGESIETEIIE